MSWTPFERDLHVMIVLLFDIWKIGKRRTRNTLPFVHKSCVSISLMEFIILFCAIFFTLFSGPCIWYLFSRSRFSRISYHATFWFGPFKDLQVDLWKSFHLLRVFSLCFEVRVFFSVRASSWVVGWSSKRLSRKHNSCHRVLHKAVIPDLSCTAMLKVT